MTSVSLALMLAILTWAPTATLAAGVSDSLKNAATAVVSTGQDQGQQAKIAEATQKGYGALLEGKYKDAIESFEAATRLAPNFHHPLLGKSIAQIMLKDYDAAAETYKRAVAAQEDVPEGYLLIYFFQDQIKDMPALKRFLDAAIAKQPNDREFQLELADYYEKTGDTAGFQSIMEKVERDAPNGADAYYLRANLAISNNRPSEANAYIEKALAADPQNARARSLGDLKKVYKKQQEYAGNGSPLWKTVALLVITLLGLLFGLAKVLKIAASKKTPNGGEKLLRFEAGVMKWAILLSFVLAIPTTALVVAKMIQSHNNSELRSVVGKDGNVDKERVAALSLDGVCRDPKLREGLGGACSQNDTLNTMTLVSFLSILIGPLVLLAISAAGQLARLNRISLLVIFFPGLYLTVFFVVALTIANAALAIGMIWFGESALIGQVHIGLMATIGIGAAAGALGVIGAALKAIRRARIIAVGKVVTTENQPTLWKFVSDLSAKAGTTAPRNIVVGLEPNFYVTEAEVLCLDGKLKGRTMYLSLPLTRTLTLDELRAVIMHELGHYRGRDTYFSTLFYPIYRGAADSIAALAGGHKAGQGAALALLPTQLMLSHFLGSFAEAENGIGRERELAADKVGSDHAGARNIATALVKLHAFAPVWAASERAMQQVVAEGARVSNVSLTFLSIAKTMKPTDLFAKLEEARLVHPMDTHPPLNIRLKALGLSIADLAPSATIPTTENGGLSIFNEAEALEEQLSEATQTLLARQ